MKKDPLVYRGPTPSEPPQPPTEEQIRAARLASVRDAFEALAKLHGIVIGLTSGQDQTLVLREAYDARYDINRALNVLLNLVAEPETEARNA